MKINRLYVQFINYIDNMKTVKFVASCEMKTEFNLI